MRHASTLGPGNALRLRSRVGMTMVELTVTLILAAIIGGAFMRIMIHQSRFMDVQSTNREARSVSRGALNVMMSELRRVTLPGGVLAASADSIVVRVPYAFGVLCASTPAASTISLAPMDSLIYSEAGSRGYAWRDSTGNYAFVNGGFSLAPGLTSDCAAAGITTLPKGRAVTVTPVVPVAAVPGTPVLLYRRIQYTFAPSVSMPGRRALWRKNIEANTREELVAPFDADARFEFVRLGATTSQAAPPTVLDSIRGLALRLAAESDRSTFATGAPSVAELQTAIFFMNRLP